MIVVACNAQGDRMVAETSIEKVAWITFMYNLGPRGSFDKL